MFMQGRVSFIPPPGVAVCNRDSIIVVLRIPGCPQSTAVFYSILKGEILMRFHFQRGQALKRVKLHGVLLAHHGSGKII